MVILDANGQGHGVFDAQRQISVHRIGSRQAGDGVCIGQRRNGSGDGVHGQNGAFFEKRPVAQGLRRGAQKFGQAVCKLGKRAGQKGEQLHRAFYRQAGFGVVDEIVKLLRRGEAHFTGAARIALGHAAAFAGEVEGAAGTVLDFQTHGNGLFQPRKDFLCLCVYGAEVFQRAQNAVHVHIGHRPGVLHGDSSSTVYWKYFNTNM